MPMLRAKARYLVVASSFGTLRNLPDSLQHRFDRYDLTAVPRPDCLKLDTGMNPADVTAQEIVRHFGLNA